MALARRQNHVAVVLVAVSVLGGGCSKLDAMLGVPDPNAPLSGAGESPPDEVRNKGGPAQVPSYTSPFSRGPDGRTRLTETTTGAKTTRKVYVSSSSGSDSNDGLSPKTPLRTLRSGTQKLRDGHPDWLLLKRGDVWEESLYLDRLSGLSARAPLVVTGYGDGPRPKLKTGRKTGIGLHPALEHKHIAIVGLYLHAHKRDPSAPGFSQNVPAFNDATGVSATTFGENLVIEDCVFRHFSGGIVVQDVEDGRLFKNAELRFNRLLDIWVAGDGFSQGVYMWKVDGILIEGNVFDLVGHNPGAGRPGSVFDHSVYLQNGTVGARTVVRHNFFSRSDGIQMREGGLAEDNLFFRTWIALMCGGGNESNEGGVVCVAKDNVIVDGADINPKEKRGWGIYAMNTKAPSAITGNVIVHNTHGHFPLSIHLSSTRKDDRGREQKITGLHIADNVVHDWGGTALWQGSSATLSGVTLENNVFQGATPDPLLTVEPASGLRGVRARGNRFFHPGGAKKAAATNEGSLSLEDWAEATGDTSAAFGETRFVDDTRDLKRFVKEELKAGSVEGWLDGLRQDSPVIAPPPTARVTSWIRAGYQRAP